MKPELLEDESIRLKIRGLARSLVSSCLLTEAARHDLVVSLYGAEEIILDYLSNEMKNYLNEMNNDHLKIIKGDKSNPHSIDVGYYFNGQKLVG